MSLPREFSLLGMPLAMLLAVAAGPVNANELFIQHNGFNIPDTPTAEFFKDSKEVNVDFGCGFQMEGRSFCLKIFNEVATHTIRLGEEASYAPEFEVPVFETVVNNTDVPWFDYHIELEGVMFDDFAIICDLVACIAEDIRVELSDDDTMAWLFFEHGLFPGSAFGIFAVLAFHGQSIVTISQTPTVPEPTTLLLLGLGLAGLGFSRRRLH